MRAVKLEGSGSGVFTGVLVRDNCGECELDVTAIGCYFSCAANNADDKSERHLQERVIIIHAEGMKHADLEQQADFSA